MNYTIEDLQKFALKQNGSCISKKYKNNKTHYRWKCKNNHTFSKRWSTLLKKNFVFCLTCDGKNIDKIPKVTLETIKNFIENKNGKIIKYINGDGVRSRYLIECNEGHQWEVKIANLLYNDTWCLKCKKLTLKDCFLEAKKRNGKCLDKIYINRRTFMNWECEKKHIFKKTLGAIRNNNSWCRKCAVDNMKHDISLAYKLAQKNNGECLSTEYVNLESHMKWKCEKGHIWETALQCIKNGTWCPYCRFKSESKCRDFFEDFLVYLLLKKD